MGKYDDIILMPHHVSPTRKAMSMEQRAAQFAPFAALNGHEEVIEETARLTDAAPDLTECEVEQISTQLLVAMEEKSQVRIDFYVPDSHKQGGRYISTTGIVREWREVEHTIVMNDGMRINFFDIVAVTPLR